MRSYEVLIDQAANLLEAAQISEELAETLRRIQQRGGRFDLMLVCGQVGRLLRDHGYRLGVDLLEATTGRHKTDPAVTFESIAWKVRKTKLKFRYKGPIQYEPPLRHIVHSRDECRTFVIRRKSFFILLCRK